MAFECLLVSRDPGVFLVMNKLLKDLAISTNICLSSSKAFEQMLGRSTDLVVVDWENDTAEFLNRVRKVGGWRKPTVVAVSPNDRIVRGADVLLRKPVTGESAAKSLKAAYSRMVYDHRRHTRYALMTRVNARNDKNQPVDITVLDIGDGGIGISTKHKFNVGDELSLSLRLPDANRAIQLQARVRWTREYGAVGCEFLHIPPLDLCVLHDWLTRKSQIKKPLVAI